MTSPPTFDALDLALLAGFRYACRPDCGLCCYAEPLVTPEERPALLRLQPPAEFNVRGRYEFLRSHTPGGACVLLEGHRCRGHSARPAPCREYPIVVHVGLRAQASVILTCPGVDLATLADYRGPNERTPDDGFASEVAALSSRWAARAGAPESDYAKRRNRLRRRLEDAGAWEEEEAVRRQLRSTLPQPGREDFPVDGPPARPDGLDLLPLFWDKRDGPVALASEPSGWELLELAPGGGIRRTVGTAPPPMSPPALTERAGAALRGYLRYWLERDQLFSIVHRQLFEAPSGTVGDCVRLELRSIGAHVLTAAAVLSSAFRGHVGALSESDLLLGVRAVDQDMLDSPSWSAPF